MELNYENLKKYITIVYELEEEAWFQNELMTRLQQKINSLGKLIRLPHYPVLSSIIHYFQKVCNLL